MFNFSIWSKINDGKKQKTEAMCNMSIVSLPFFFPSLLKRVNSYLNEWVWDQTLEINYLISVNIVHAPLKK